MFKKLCILEILLLIVIVILLIFTSCATTQKQPIVEIETIEKPEITDNLDNSLSDLTKQITNSITEDGKKKIAVIEFSDLEGNVTQFGKYLAEELITRLFRTRKFEVVERQLLNKVLSEQKLGITGLIDDESAIAIGKLLGVDAIVSGTITDLGISLKVNARIISTETGKVFGVAGTKIVKDETVEKLMGIISTVKKEEVQKQTEEKEISKQIPKNIPINEVLWNTRGWIIELVSYRIFSNRSIKFILTVENLQEIPADFEIRSGYLLDNLTNKYHEPIISPKGTVKIIQNNPINYSITFNNLKEDIRIVVLYLSCFPGEFPHHSSPIKITDPIVQKEEVQELTEKKEISKKVLKKVEAENFTFELTKCEISSGGRVTCDLLITNNDDKDRELRLFIMPSRTRMFDDFGNEYSPNQWELANKKGVLSTGIHSTLYTPYSGVQSLLISGISTKASLNFKNVIQDASGISLLEIGFREQESGEFKVQFRNIPLSMGY